MNYSILTRNHRNWSVCRSANWWGHLDRQELDRHHQFVISIIIRDVNIITILHYYLLEREGLREQLFPGP
jgi:hypothetical protein